MALLAGPAGLGSRPRVEASRAPGRVRRAGESLNTLLTLAAIYTGILGIGFILVPRAIGIGAVPEDASTALIAYLRILGSPFLGRGVARRVSPR